MTRFYIARDYTGPAARWFANRPTLGPSGEWITADARSFDLDSAAGLAPGELVEARLGMDGHRLTTLGVFEPDFSALKGNR